MYVSSLKLARRRPNKKISILLLNFDILFKMVWSERKMCIVYGIYKGSVFLGCILYMLTTLSYCLEVTMDYSKWWILVLILWKTVGHKV